MQSEIFNFMSLAGMMYTGFRRVRKKSVVMIPEKPTKKHEALVVEALAGET
jgi:hypothetical protein